MSRNQYCLVVLAFCALALIVINVEINRFLYSETSERLEKTDTNQMIVIYNRIPKTGSTTLTNAVMYDLCRRNGFSVIHLNMTSNRYMINLADQQRFISNITAWKTHLPAVYHGHVAFVDFTRFGYPNPVYINVVREPLERLLSYYYFLRYGDNYRVGLKRSRAGKNETFDGCIKRGGRDCDIKQIWLQIPYFCGTHHFCSEVGSERALAVAKQNLVNHYLVVGLTEKLREFIEVLEKVLPKFFNGALKHFDSLNERRSHLRSTKKKIPPNEATLEIVRSNVVYQMELDFYNFASDQFNVVRSRMMNHDQTEYLPQQFHYEKIKS
ncbi:hypothetical protein AB6A40_000434 [Gnathostoma spinigerum]|uniref:Heparan sulfate 2-O-sulfotransferase n=1 Tax=Gnathostoma spinigerum TaxID=75299 RepID=A0ABD6EBR0_9BILA